MGRVTGVIRREQFAHLRVSITGVAPLTIHSVAALATCAVRVTAASPISTAAKTFQGGWKRVQPSQQRGVELDSNLTPLRLRFEGTHQRAPNKIFSRVARFLIL